MPDARIISIDRPAAYWLERARKISGRSRLPEAALFIRKALEKNDSPEVALELAWVYYHMHCYNAVERLLLRVLARSPHMSGAYYLMGLNALARGEEGPAQDALDKYLRLCPGGVGSEHAQDLLSYYPWKDEYIPRRGARAYLLRERANAAPHSQALSLAKRAFRCDHSAHSALLLAEKLLDENDFSGALRYLNIAQKRGGEDAFSMQIAFARAYYGLDRVQESRKCLERARQVFAESGELEKLCRTALETQCPDLSLEVSSEALKETPFDTCCLHMVYLSQEALRHKREAIEARKSILAIDPSDPAVLGDGGQSTARVRGQLLIRQALYAMAVPDKRLRKGRLNRLLHLLTLALQDSLDLEDVYSLVPPMYFSLPRRVRTHIEEEGRTEWNLAFAACLLLMKNDEVGAQKLMRATPRLRRTLRCAARIRRCLQKELDDSQKEKNNEMYQF